ncbi:MAG: hypothetical protein JO038_07300 [Alphaproteobacteria bacterium]|nr:hypothetical protein [Alphaproteobacteria bacterium]
MLRKFLMASAVAVIALIGSSTWSSSEAHWYHAHYFWQPHGFFYNPYPAYNFYYAPACWNTWYGVVCR